MPSPIWPFGALELDQSFGNPSCQWTSPEFDSNRLRFFKWRKRPNHPSHVNRDLVLSKPFLIDLGIHQAVGPPHYWFVSFAWFQQEKGKTFQVHVRRPRTGSWPLALDLLCSMGRWAVRPNTVRPVNCDWWEWEDLRIRFSLGGGWPSGNPDKSW